MNKYDYTITPWQVMAENFPRDRSDMHKLGFLLRYAILAPSSHNTQPWKFAVSDDEIAIFINKDRWLRVADADQRELYTSVGCALENLLIAAEHFGYGHHVEYFPEPANLKFVAAVEFVHKSKPSLFRVPELFDAIRIRHTNHKPYQARAVPESALQHLRACMMEAGASLYLSSELETRRRVDELVNRADATLFADPAFREELGCWIGEGAFGTPWLLSKLAQLAIAHLDLGQYAAKKDEDLLMGSPVLGVLCAAENDRLSQVKIGQAFERIYLTASTLGLRLQPMSQIVEVPETRAALASIIAEAEGVPQQPFRLGYAEAERSHTPRRALEEVMV